MKSAIVKNAKAVVSSKGQVVIPWPIREVLGIHAGSELIFEAHQNGVLEVTPVKRTIDMFFGCCKKKNEPALSVDEMDEAIMQAVSDQDENTKDKE